MRLRTLGLVVHGGKPEAAEAAEVARAWALRRGVTCAEIGGAERGAPLDIAAAFGDMITYNGGQPLHCRA